MCHGFVHGMRPVGTKSSSIRSEYCTWGKQCQTAPHDQDKYMYPWVDPKGCLTHTTQRCKHKRKPKKTYVWTGRRKHKNWWKDFLFLAPSAYACVVPVHTYVFLHLRLCLRRCVVRVNQPKRKDLSTRTPYIGYNVVFSLELSKLSPKYGVHSNMGTKLRYYLI